jgi:hypothetical protein
MKRTQDAKSEPGIAAPPQVEISLSCDSVRRQRTGNRGRRKGRLRGANDPMKRLVAVVLGVILLTASPSMAQETSMTNRVLQTVGDVVLMRPFTFAATVIGFTLFVVGYPVIALTDNDTAWEDLVAKPGRATFTRCIGCDLIEDRDADDPDIADPAEAS